MLTVFDVVRNQYFYLSETLAQELPDAIFFVVSCAIPIHYRHITIASARAISIISQYHYDLAIPIAVTVGAL